MFGERSLRAGGIKGPIVPAILPLMTRREKFRCSCGGCGEKGILRLREGIRSESLRFAENDMGLSYNMDPRCAGRSWFRRRA
jgi:hypothetical protein